jgi:hypothetical protein
MKILLYNPDNGVTRNFMPHLWMFLLQALTPHGHEVLFENFQRKASFQLHPDRSQNRPNGLRRAPLPPDHFAKIFGMDAQFEQGHHFAFYDVYLYLFGVVYKCFRDGCHQVLHPIPRGYLG